MNGRWLHDPVIKTKQCLRLSSAKLISRLVYTRHWTATAHIVCTYSSVVVTAHSKKTWGGGGSRGSAPVIINQGTRCSGVINFIGCFIPGAHWIKGWVGPKAGVVSLGHRLKDLGASAAGLSRPHSSRLLFCERLAVGYRPNSVTSQKSKGVGEKISYLWLESKPRGIKHRVLFLQG